MNDLTTIATISPRGRITAEERARRKAEVDFARGNVRLEGFVLSATVEELNRRYVEGEITGAELSDAIRKRHGL